MADTLDQLAAPPVFVVGYERSGTTLMYEALAAHPLVAGVFESWMFHDRLGLGGLFDETVWDEAKEELRREHVGHRMAIAQLLSREQLVADTRALAGGWLARALEPEHRYLVEKTPVHLFRAPVIAELFPGARFVEMVRDGRDVAVSSLASNSGWGGRVGRRPGATGVREAARDWQANIQLGRRHEGALAGQWLRVRFEDLRADIDATASRVFAFCGIPCDAETLALVRQATDLGQHRVDDASFRRGGRVGGWQRRFSFRDALAFDRAAHTMLVRSGYAANRRWVLQALRPRRRR